MNNGLLLEQAGELERKIRNVADWLAQHEIGTFWGELTPEDGFLDATWDVDLAPEIEPFLALAKSAAARVVFIDCTRCDLEELVQQTSTSEAPELEALIARLSAHSGEVAEASIRWVSDRVVHEFTLSASWASDYFTAWERVQAASDDVDEDDLEDDGPDEDQVQSLAESLARNPKFQAARSGSQRMLVARRGLESAVVADKELLGAVVEAAKSIFELELKPDIERAEAEKVADLMAKGMTKAQIIQRLGISANKMKTKY